jgi:hypothetical protein
MLQQRRYVIREKSQLQFCYEAILYHAQDILAKRKCEYWNKVKYFFVHCDVQHILCCVLLCFSLSCVLYVASFSGWSIFDCPFGIL